MVRQKEAVLKVQSASIQKAQDSIDAERANFKTVSDRLQFDNNYLRLEIEKMKGLIPDKA